MKPGSWSPSPNADSRGHHCPLTPKSGLKGAKDTAGYKGFRHPKSSGSTNGWRVQRRKWDRNASRPLKQELPKRASGIPVRVQNSGAEGMGMQLRPLQAGHMIREA